jgi:carboxyl-terminal processing protease
VRVVEVPEGGPAERAGLRADDRILSIDGKPVAGRTSEAVQASLSGDVGSVAAIEVLRDGQRLTLSIERVPYATPNESKGGAR